MLGSEHVGPEVWASGGRYRGENLGHAGANDEGCRRSVEGRAWKNSDRTEHADDDPPNGHDSGPTCIQTIAEETKIWSVEHLEAARVVFSHVVIPVTTLWTVRRH